MGSINFFLMFLILGFFFNVLPWALALTSDKAERYQKLIWFVMSFLFSWIGYFVYYYVIIEPDSAPVNYRNRVLKDKNGKPVRNLYR
jgi:hypothetical protein